MKLEPPYKQYEGSWLSGAKNSPVYFIAKFLRVTKDTPDSFPVIEFLVVARHTGISELAWFPEPSFLSKFKDFFQRRDVIKWVFEKKNET